jgi:hypothetical protein
MLKPAGLIDVTGFGPVNVGDRDGSVTGTVTSSKPKITRSSFAVDCAG